MNKLERFSGKNNKRNGVFLSVFVQAAWFRPTKLISGNYYSSTVIFHDGEILLSVFQNKKK